MNNLVQAAKTNTITDLQTIPLTVDRVNKLIKLVNSIVNDEDLTNIESVVEDQAKVQESAKNRLDSQIRDSALTSFIALSDATTEL